MTEKEAKRDAVAVACRDLLRVAGYSGFVIVTESTNVSPELLIHESTITTNFTFEAQLQLIEAYVRALAEKRQATDKAVSDRLEKIARGDR